MEANPYKPPECDDGPDQNAQVLSTTFRIGTWHALLASIGVGLGWTLTATLIGAVTGQPALISGLLAFVLLFLGSLIAMIFGWIRGRRSRGMMLIDCGPNPVRWLFLVNAFFTFVMAFTDTFPAHFRIAFGLPFSCYWIFMASGHLSFHDNGIWIYHGFVPWPHLQRCEWSGPETLIVFRQSRFFGRSRSAVKIPVQHRASVTALLIDRKLLKVAASAIGS